MPPREACEKARTAPRRHSPLLGRNTLFDWLTQQPAHWRSDDGVCVCVCVCVCVRVCAFSSIGRVRCCSCGAVECVVNAQRFGGNFHRPLHCSRWTSTRSLFLSRTTRRQWGVQRRRRIPSYHHANTRDQPRMGAFPGQLAPWSNGPVRRLRLRLLLRSGLVAQLLLPRHELPQRAPGGRSSRPVPLAGRLQARLSLPLGVRWRFQTHWQSRTPPQQSPRQTTTATCRSVDRESASAKPSAGAFSATCSTAACR